MFLMDRCVMNALVSSVGGNLPPSSVVVLPAFSIIVSIVGPLYTPCLVGKTIDHY